MIKIHEIFIKIFCYSKVTCILASAKSDMMIFAVEKMITFVIIMDELRNTIAIAITEEKPITLTTNRRQIIRNGIATTNQAIIQPKNPIQMARAMATQKMLASHN